MAITFDADTSTKNLYIDGLLEAEAIDQGYAPVTAEDRDVASWQRW